MQRLVDPAFEGGTPVIQAVDLPGQVDKDHPEGLFTFAGAKVILDLPELVKCHVLEKLESTCAGHSRPANP